MARDLGLRVLFDTVADLYDEVRPGYPEALVDGVVAISGIPAKGRILEIGAGTGQATRLFAGRGFRITALELGANMAARAVENLREYPDVGVLNVALEDWAIEAGAFDLAVSASSFHWLAPEVGFGRCAEALKPGGFLAMFWNGDPRPTGGVYDAIQAAYERHVPEMKRRHSADLSDDTHLERIQAFAASGLFEAPVVREYEWTRRLTGEQYSRLICTYSDHIVLPDEQRSALCCAIRAAIEAHGGVLEKLYRTRLYVGARV